MVNVSVCTIYANRQKQLQNLVRGLIDSSLQPKELIVVCMNDRLPELPSTDFAIASATIDREKDCLPLATARNKAAALATEDKLVFLDVDCICDRYMLENFNYHLNQEDALYSGSVRYLHSDWQQDNWTLETLQQQSTWHKLQGHPVQGKDKVAHPYELFWSLCFGMHQSTFEAMGGFDTEYIGYGGEDTDFSFVARSQKIPLYKISALAYHQFHPSYAPPLNHLAEIVNNAEVFYRKWGIMPMDKWLSQFADRGYIAIEDNKISIVKLPTEIEIAACIKDT